MAHWLVGLGFGQLAQVFAENGIDVEVLSRLNSAIERERSIK
jgi:hypothetical protein